MNTAETKPTLLEVLSYFKNAKEVVCNFEPYSGNYELFKLAQSINYDEPTNSYYCDSANTFSDVMLWCGKTNQYAEIVSYNTELDQIQPEPIPKNPSAFPLPNDCETIQGSEGMTLRDYFANSAMQGMISFNGILNVEIFANVEKAYEIADEMLKQREL